MIVGRSVFVKVPLLGLKSSCVCTAAFTVSVLALTNESPFKEPTKGECLMPKAIAAFSSLPEGMYFSDREL